jgi:hypothetical protein
VHSEEDSAPASKARIPSSQAASQGLIKYLRSEIIRVKMERYEKDLPGEVCFVWTATRAHNNHIECGHEVLKRQNFETKFLVKGKSRRSLNSGLAEIFKSTCFTVSLSFPRLRNSGSSTSPCIQGTQSRLINMSLKAKHHPQQIFSPLSAFSAVSCISLSN